MSKETRDAWAMALGNRTQVVVVAVVDFGFVILILFICKSFVIVFVVVPIDYIKKTKIINYDNNNNNRVFTA